MQIRRTLIVVFLCSIAVVGRSQSLTPGISIGANQFKYSETEIEDGERATLAGKSYTLPQLELSLRLSDVFSLPLFLECSASGPLAIGSSGEIKTLEKPAGPFTTQTDDVEHSESSLIFRAGATVARELNVFGFFERSHVKSHRSNLMLGEDDGLLHAHPDVWDENVWASHIGIGADWEMELLSKTTGISIGVEAGIPIAVFVSNTSTHLDPGMWGQNATGYQYAAELCLYDEFSQRLRGSVNFRYSRRHWNGDGADWVTDIHHIWPENTESITQLSFGLKYRLGSMEEENAGEHEEKREEKHE